MPIQNAQSISFYKIKIFGFFIVLALITACSNLVKTQNQQAPTEAAATDIQNQTMDADTLYRVMAAELEGSAGEVSKALSNYLEAALLSDDPEVAKRATILSIRARSWQHAAMAADRWQLLEPNNLDATKALATAQLASGNYSAAGYQLELLFSGMAGTETEKWQAITKLLVNAPGGENAMDLFQQLMDKYPLTGKPKAVAEARLAQSRLAAKLTDLELARELSIAAANTLQQSTKAQIWAGRLAISAGDMPAATPFFKQAWKIEPDNEDLAIAYAEMLHRQKRVLEAESVLASLPQTGSVIVNRMMFAVVEKSPQRAEKLYQSLAVAVDADSPEHTLRMARAADLLRLNDDAIKWYAKVPETEDSWLPARLRLAVLLTEQQKYDAGMEVLEQLKQEPHNEVIEQAWLAEAQILQRDNQVEAAARALQSGLVQLPESIELSYSLGLLQAQLENVTAAETAFRKVLSLQPDNPAALNALGYTLTDLTDRHTEALEYIQRAYALEPDDIAIIDSMGWVMYRLERHQDALRYLKLAFSQDKNAEIGAHLGEVLWVMGLQADAREIFNQARSIDPENITLVRTLERLGL